MRKADVVCLAHRFLDGDFEDELGGFPSVAFHDGYRNYLERVPHWIRLGPSAHTSKQDAQKQAETWLLHFDAGALARFIEGGTQT